MIDYTKNIIASGTNIYDITTLKNFSLFIPADILEYLLNNGLIGISLTGLPLRTRSKFVKALVCKALGYPVPDSFLKTKPSFPAQNMDIYIQKSMNLQIWNEEIESTRRYAIIQVDNFDKIKKVRIIIGNELVLYDKTGTLTTKYQAMMPDMQSGQLFSKKDTPSVEEWCSNGIINLKFISPINPPIKSKLLPINIVYTLLKTLEGTSIPHMDALQERNRGAFLHQCICEKLGYSTYIDKGTYPDILNQLIEIKLQTSPTIDLGLHSPDDGEIVYTQNNKKFYSADIRYVIMRGVKVDENIFIKHLFMATGADFTGYFRIFGGKVQNAKLQIPLPKDFFD